MPYLPHARRVNLRDAPTPTLPGDLAFLLTDMCLDYLLGAPGTVNYAKLNAAIGALECTKLELYRRMIAPYEDLKRHENGDVYPQEVQ